MIAVTYPDGAIAHYNNVSEALWDVAEDFKGFGHDREIDLTEYLMAEDGFPIGSAHEHYMVDGEHIYPTQTMFDVMTRCVIRCIACGRQGLT